MLTNFVQSLGCGFGNIRTAFHNGIQKSGWNDLQAIFASALGGDNTNRKKSPAVQLREYQSWIYVILTTIYGRTSTVPWNLFVQRPGNELEELNNQFDHPLYKLLTKPNPFMTGTFFRQYIQMSLDLTGMAFIWKIKNGLRRPAELWPLNVAEFVDFIPGETTKDFVKGYSFTTMDFPREDIIYLYYPNPNPTFSTSLSTQRSNNLLASLAGMSPVQAEARIVDIEKYIEIYERDFFENSARPDVILKAGEKALPEKERNRLLKAWNQKHKGPNKFHEPTILSRGMDVDILKLTNKDFEFFKLAGWTKDMLFATYSVPEAKAGLVKDGNRANDFSTERTFNQECVLPRLNLWDESFTNQLAHDFDEKLVVKHDNPVPSDKEAILERQKFELGSFVKSINQVREEEGLDPVPWGKKPWMPFNLVQPGDGSTEQEAPQEVQEESVTLIEHKTDKNQFLPTEQQKVAFWKTFDARVRKHERQFIIMVRKLFKAQQKEVLANLNAVAPQIEAQFAGWSAKKIARYVKQNPKLIKDILFDPKDAVDKFEKAGEPLIAEAFEDAGEATLADLEIDINFNLENPRAKKFIGKKTEKFAKEVNETTAKELTKTLREGFSEGESVSKLASRIKKVYDKADSSRAIVIARTEIIASSNAGSLEGMKQSGVVKKKEWLSSRDDRVRDSHVSPLDGQEAKLNENFTSNDGNDAQHPGGFGVAAEDVQCRCTVIAVVE